MLCRRRRHRVHYFFQTVGIINDNVANPIVCVIHLCNARGTGYKHLAAFEHCYGNLLAVSDSFATAFTNTHIFSTMLHAFAATFGYRASWRFWIPEVVYLDSWIRSRLKAAYVVERGGNQHVVKIFAPNAKWSSEVAVNHTAHEVGGGHFCYIFDDVRVVVVSLIVLRLQFRYSFDFVGYDANNRFTVCEATDARHVNIAIFK